MNKRYLFVVPFLAMALASCGGGEPPTPVIETFTITWKDFDQTVLATSIVNKDVVPTYPNGTPVRASTPDYEYTFKGWNPEVVAATADATYVAEYNSTKRLYSVTYYDEDGTTILDQQMVDYGSTPEYAGETPSKADAGGLTYEFDGWDHAESMVTGEQTYTATYNSSPLYFVLEEDHYYVNGLLSSTGYPSTITIPSTWRGKPVSGVADSAFRERHGIQKVILNNGNIGAYAFYEDENIKEIVFNNDITYDIKQYAFGRCTGLETLVLPDNITLAGYAFNSCYNLKQIETGKTLPSYGSLVFQNCYTLTELVNNTSETITSFSWAERYLLKIVNANQKGTFGKVPGENSTDLNLITYKPYGETDVYIVGTYDNEGRSILRTGSATKIKQHAFFGNEHLEKAYIGSSITSLGIACFEATPLTEVHFEGTSQLEISAEAFRDCSSLTTVDFGSRQITALRSMTFASCASLTSFVIPNTVTEIEGEVFTSTGISNLNIPASVSNITSNPATRSLQSYTVDSENPYFKAVNDVLFSKDGKRLIAYPGLKAATEYTIPEGTTILGRYALGSVKNLVTVHFPSTLTEMGYAALVGLGDGNDVTLTYPGTVEQFSGISGVLQWWTPSTFKGVTCSDGTWTK